MNIFKNKELIFSIFLSLLLGGLIFILIFGVNIINPFDDNWIFNLQFHRNKIFYTGFPTLDIKQSYIGWQFYKDTPFSFPLGMFDGLSYPVKTSILNTDSIPLFALLFKFLFFLLPKSLRPDVFQYHGLWMLLCFMLQCCFGMLICRKFIKTIFKDNSNELLKISCYMTGGILFVLLPVLFYGFYMLQIAISSHWTILLCLLPLFYYEELTEKQKLLFYIASGFILGLIHPYLIAMCSIIVLLFSIFDFLKTKSNLVPHSAAGSSPPSKCSPFEVVTQKFSLTPSAFRENFLRQNLKSFKYLLLFVLSAAFSLFLIGGFSMNAINANQNSIDRLRTSSFNLNGFFNSENLPVYLNIFHFPAYSNSSEGFSYLGAGVIYLLFISAISYIIPKAYRLNHPHVAAVFRFVTPSACRENLFRHKTQLILMLIFIVFSIILALSPRISYNYTVLFEYKPPVFIEQFWAVFRNTGRFIWVAYYLIVIIILFSIFNKFKIKTVLFLLISAVFIQIIDMHICCKAIYNLIHKPNNYKYKYINDDKLSYLIKNNKNIKVLSVFLTGGINEIFDIAEFAYRNNLKITGFYFARAIKQDGTSLLDDSIVLFILDDYDFPKSWGPVKKFYLEFKPDIENFYQIDKNINFCQFDKDVYLVSKSKLNGCKKIEL